MVISAGWGFGSCCLPFLTLIDRSTNPNRSMRLGSVLMDTTMRLQGAAPRLTLVSGIMIA